MELIQEHVREHNVSGLPLAIKQKILQVLNLSALNDIETVQSLWSGYGEIIRCSVDAGAPIIVKYVHLGEPSSHPRGWNTQVSHQRKLRSYQVEANFYQHWATRCDNNCRVAKSLMVETASQQSLMVLEDLDAAGYPRRITSASLSDIKSCLDWLANFHVCFLGEASTRLEVAHVEQSLWPIGSYWHLATRQDELAALDDANLRQAAAHIDARLNQCDYQTLIHGDAKLANFCFAESGSKVAAVDFQYVGWGCGIKDVMLLLSSALNSEQCEQDASELVDYYFSVLRGLCASGREGILANIDITALETQWRELYCFAWADFVRFLKGWSPGHWKVHAYSEQQTQIAIHQLSHSLRVE